MEITDIKNRLEIMETASVLGITIDPKTKRACCPFHEDKTPSLQFSREKQIATCFSTACDAGTMDVIGLVEKKLQLSTHEALNYLTNLAGESQPIKASQKQNSLNYATEFEQMQSSFIASSTARAYVESRNLDKSRLDIGYNAFKTSKFTYLRGCITFGLRDRHGHIVSLYGRSVRDNDKAKHYYTSNRKGLYPKYPDSKTTKLILTESVIDTATLLSLASITKDYSILSLYGTNGMTTEHLHAIQELEILNEIIFFFDGDEAGRMAIEKHGKHFQSTFPSLKLTTVETPESEDINSLATGHESSIFDYLLKGRKELSFSDEASHGHLKNKSSIEQKNETENTSFYNSSLDSTNPNSLRYLSETAIYYIKGGIRKDLDSLKVSLVIESIGSASNLKSRNKLDLYEDKQTEKISRESAEKLGLRSDLIERDLSILTDLLDEYREHNQSQAKEQTRQNFLTTTQKEKCLSFLKSPNLLQKINELIGKSGVVGEENNRIFLFGIASSYKMNDTLHALVQGSSGSGKTHLLATIMDFMPPEDCISLTRVTESSFYNYGQYELQNKLIGMEDYDGLEEKAELAFRELQSKGMISSSTSGKNEHTGEITGYIKTVYGPIASLSATTKGEIYEDNMSRCFLVAVDESHEQTLRIIRYQNDKAAGLVSRGQEAETREFLRNCMRLLKSNEVVNPYANRIDLPKEAHKIRRLNDLFQSYVKQVTLLNQYQRKKDQQGRILTDKEDVRIAIEIMFDSIILKVDELDGSLRDFYESLKSYILKKGKDYEFIQREIRHCLNLSKTQLFRYIQQLEALEYIQKRGYGSHGAVKYKIVYWDDNQVLRSRVRQNLSQQLERL